MLENTESMKVWVTVIGGVAGLLPVLSKLFVDRSAATKSNRLISQARENIELIAAWKTVRDAAGTATDADERNLQVASELDKTWNRYRAGMDSLDERKASSTDVGARTRTERLFLLYTPSRWVAWIWHILFFAILGMIPFFLLGESLDADGNSSLKTLQDNAASTWASLAVFAVFATVFNLLARRADRPRKARQEQSTAGY